MWCGVDQVMADLAQVDPERLLAALTSLGLDRVDDKVGAALLHCISVLLCAVD